MAQLGARGVRAHHGHPHTCPGQRWREQLIVEGQPQHPEGGGFSREILFLLHKDCSPSCGLCSQAEHCRVADLLAWATSALPRSRWGSRDDAVSR